MPTCELGFDHPEPEPAVEVHEAPDMEPVAEAEVEVARIQADRDVAVAKIEHRAIDEELLARVAALEAQNEALRAQAAPPEPEGPPIVVEAAPEPEPGPEVAPPPVHEEAAEAKAKKKTGFWDGYR